MLIIFDIGSLEKTLKDGRAKRTRAIKVVNLICPTFTQKNV
jgi:hypothetical protein